MAVDIVVAGHLCLDVIPHMVSAAAPLTPGSLVETGPVTFALGGCVANTGLTLHKLGLRVKLMGCVGDDEFGHITHRLLKQHDTAIAHSINTVEKDATSYTIVIAPPGVDRLFLHHPGCNESYTVRDVEYSVLETARLFHFGYPPLMKALYINGGKGLEGLLQRAKATGVTTSLDMAMPDFNGLAGTVNWEKVLKRTLPYVDLFIPSLEEIYLMLYRKPYPTGQREPPDSNLLAEVSQALLRWGPAMVGLKLGQHGLYLHTASSKRVSTMGRAAPTDTKAWGDRELWAPVFNVSSQGTTGAGDATVAGFLAGLLRQNTPERACTMATAVGACSVEAADSLSGVVSWKQTLERIQKGWPRQEQLFPRGWVEGAASGSFIGPNDKSNYKEENS